MEKRPGPDLRALVYGLTDESITLAKRQAKIAKEIAKLTKEMERRPPIRKARRRRRKVTPEIVASVKQMAAQFPDMLLDEIAQAHDIDGGRVSEILAGKRGG